MPLNLPFGVDLPQWDSSETLSKTLRARGFCLSNVRRNSNGSFPPALAASSIALSSAKMLWDIPTERQYPKEIGRFD